MTAVVVLTLGNRESLRDPRGPTFFPHLRRVRHQMREEKRRVSSLATAGCCRRFAGSETGGYGVEAERERTFSQVGDPHSFFFFGTDQGKPTKSKYMVLVLIGCS